MERYASKIKMYLGPWGFQAGRLDYDGLIEVGRQHFLYGDPDLTTARKIALGGILVNRMVDALRTDERPSDI
ncbi:MAG: hypothetical protein IT337_15260 [Thermomicrobiales bacterium]|nr:hypothetical protein [Thermomicrobiales bacterium]